MMIGIMLARLPAVATTMNQSTTTNLNSRSDGLPDYRRFIAAARRLP
jgi:hypothetical protein